MNNSTNSQPQRRFDTITPAISFSCTVRQGRPCHPLPRGFNIPTPRPVISDGESASGYGIALVSLPTRCVLAGFGIRGSNRSGEGFITLGRIMHTGMRCLVSTSSLRVSIQPSALECCPHSVTLLLSRAVLARPKSNKHNDASLKPPLVSSALNSKRSRLASDQIQSYSVHSNGISLESRTMHANPKASSTLTRRHPIFTRPPQESDPQRSRSFVCGSGRRLLPGPFSEMSDWIPFGDPSSKLGIAFVSDKRPALFIANVVVGVDGAVLDQRFGVFEVTVDGLDRGGNSILLHTVRGPQTPFGVAIAHDRRMNIPFVSAPLVPWP